MKEGDEYIQVLVTVDEKDRAKDIAAELVEEHLAACVQIVGPIESTYRWEDSVQSSEEYMCLAKSKREFYPRLEKRVKDIHPYENPEIVVLPIVEGSDQYLSWLKEGLR